MGLSIGESSSMEAEETLNTLLVVSSFQKQKKNTSTVIKVIKGHQNNLIDFVELIEVILMT